MLNKELKKILSKLFLIIGYILVAITILIALKGIIMYLSIGATGNLLGWCSFTGLIAFLCAFIHNFFKKY